MVTARQNDGSAFQFHVADTRLLATVKIGQPVWLDAAGAVSLEGAPNCCKLVAASQPPGGATGLGVTASPQTTAQAPAARQPLGTPRQAEPPDLAIQKLSLKDCATRGLPTAGKPVCAEIEYFNGSGVVMSPWEVECTMGGLVKTAPGHLPKRMGLGIVNVDFGVVMPGAHLLSCTVDSRNQVTETNEKNNSKSAQVTVPGYDLAITAIRGTLTQTTSGALYTSLNMTLKNNGDQVIRQVGGECAFTSTVPGLPPRPKIFFNSQLLEVKPGESHPFSIHIGATSPGVLRVSCTARIVQPFGVMEGNTANNTLSETLR